MAPAKDLREPNPQAFKHLIGGALLERMSLALGNVYPEFDRLRFRKTIRILETLELKPRVRFLRDELHRQLPPKFKDAVNVLLASTRSITLKGFDLWPYTEFIQTYGLEYPEISLKALEKLTCLFTSEFAVRPFLREHPKLTLEFLTRCTLSKNEHHRRWASEGTRPRLPWGERLHDFVRDPSPTILLLEHLKFDSTIYVRKSVSNHLNDIARDHPERVVQILAKWKREGGTEHAIKVNWIIHRALRTLIKTGHSGALQLIGVGTNPKIEVTDLKLHPGKLRIGEALEFAFSVYSKSASPQKLVIDYIVHFQKSTGRTTPKVFKLKTITLEKNTKVHVTKRHSFKPITTRVFYSGAHAIEIQINGQSFGKRDFELRV